MQTGVGKSKIGRNDHCPCGSGLKYKKCCGKTDPDAAEKADLSSSRWLVRRQVLLAVGVIGGLALDAAMPKLTWFTALAAASIVALTILGWLAIKKNRSLNPYSNADIPDIDWSDPCSLTEPFFPISRYPVRFFLVVSAMAFAGGIAATVRNYLIDGRIIAPVAGLFLALGGLTLVVLLPWLQQCRFEHDEGKNN